MAELYTQKLVMESLGVGRDRLKTLIRTGELVKKGARITRDSVIAYLGHDIGELPQIPENDEFRAMAEDTRQRNIRSANRKARDADEFWEAKEESLNKATEDNEASITELSKQTETLRKLKEEEIPASKAEGKRIIAKAESEAEKIKTAYNARVEDIDQREARLIPLEETLATREGLVSERETKVKADAGFVTEREEKVKALEEKVKARELASWGPKPTPKPRPEPVVEAKPPKKKREALIPQSLIDTMIKVGWVILFIALGIGAFWAFTQGA